MQYKTPGRVWLVMIDGSQIAFRSKREAVGHARLFTKRSVLVRVVGPYVLATPAKKAKQS